MAEIVRLTCTERACREKQRVWYGARHPAGGILVGTDAEPRRLTACACGAEMREDRLMENGKWPEG